MKEKVIGIVLAAGKGKRMEADTSKQFLLINKRPMLYYSLQAFENSKIDEVVLVTGEEDIDFCREQVVEKYGFKKVGSIIAGGKERYNSVYNALQSIASAGYILIHDSARPMITPDIINDVISEVGRCNACIVAVPVKDTIKYDDNNGSVGSTLDRSRLWQIQTPQAFDFELIKNAYEHAMNNKIEGITDDAMVLEAFNSAVKIKIVKGIYENIKVTTIEDIKIAEIFTKN